jgi:hypothetical protein
MLQHDPEKWEPVFGLDHAAFLKLAREPQISLRNLRKLDCFTQNRHPLLLVARV